jgi:S-DNA-T family DNA segregation ATPase FtsK/SpoIIIE
VHPGVDKNGEHVYVNLAERSMLLGGEPGAGKSSGLNLITAHGAL